ncbi:MAG TPA: carboxypeptidase-like regulatory domain-containing protein [Bacteroidales bacterium]|nr:carboxypeptidase-like regulatory domain-containing protein [Bacteroidales bacterium]
MNKILYIILLSGLSFSSVYSQEETEIFVQVSGIITDIDMRPVYGASITSKKLRRTTISEPSGIYSITSIPGDTVFFRALGYKRYHTVIPEDYTGRFATVDIMLESDTIEIEPITILPWKTYSEFLNDMTKERPVDPRIENMNENLASIYVAMNNESGVRVTPEAGYRYAMEQNFSAIATRQQYPVNNLLNPFAWAKFVNGVRNGLLKNQKFDKPTKSKVRKKKN